MRLARTMIGVAATLACVVGASVALAASSSTTPAGGPIQMFVQPGQSQGNGKVLITGAVGDYGPSRSATIGGKRIGTAVLQKGTIKFDLTAITAKVNNASPSVDTATCSAALTETAAAPVVGGTGLYAGIHGTVQITESFGYIGSTYKSGSKKGQCNMSNNAPTVAQTGIVYGTGSVSF